MSSQNYDLIIVGGGLGGSALAKVMAEKGARVLLLEREQQYRDRVRGEWIAPWGAVEAKELGLYNILLRECANAVEGWDTYFGEVHVGLRNFTSTTPQALPSLTFYHPEMQQTLLRAASDAGAEVRQGATVRGVRTGSTPAVTFELDGRLAEATARIVVGADGRNSMMRTAAHFEVSRDAQHLFIAGVILEGISTPSPSATLNVLNPTTGSAALLVPNGERRSRGYLVFPADTGDRLQGSSDVAKFIDQCVAAGAKAEWYSEARPAGPLATFDGADHWVDQPYMDGIVLLGDAAASSDPTYGQGQALTLRDVRVLRDHLVSQSDWNAAGHAYAAEHDRYYAALHKGENWFTTVFFKGGGPKADAIRERALPLIAADPTRVPDFLYSGPEVPLDEAARRRFFGED
jgi:2-polyprenyl-6-methoxyphenol hydroxylase-like FAD-dependent oxidoreductase